MPRPKKIRFVSAYPVIAAFVPQGVTIAGEVFMSVEELESIRLSDFEHLDQETAANNIGISASFKVVYTFLQIRNFRYQSQICNML